MEYTEIVNQRMKTLEANLQKKAEIMDLEKLQKRVEENETKSKKYRRTMGKEEHGLT